MNIPHTCRSAGQITAWVLTFLIGNSCIPVFADGGNVLPPSARPRGYSLIDMAKVTAYFNTGPRTGAPPASSIVMLYVPSDGNLEFSLSPGTMHYVPAVYSDHTDSALWTFPDVNDPQAVSEYYYSPSQLGAEFINVKVDGNVTSLPSKYPVGVQTPGLPSGGNNYTVAAAFLTPLSKGTHAVTIAAWMAGAFIAMHPEIFPDGVFEFEVTYTVHVN
jgi:hypothetical protein